MSLLVDLMYKTLVICQFSFKETRDIMFLVLFIKFKILALMMARRCGDVDKILSSTSIQ